MCGPNRQLCFTSILLTNQHPVNISDRTPTETTKLRNDLVKDLANQEFDHWDYKGSESESDTKMPSNIDNKRAKLDNEHEQTWARVQSQKLGHQTNNNNNDKINKHRRIRRYKKIEDRQGHNWLQSYITLENMYFDSNCLNDLNFAEQSHVEFSFIGKMNNNISNIVKLLHQNITYLDKRLAIIHYNIEILVKIKFIFGDARLTTIKKLKLMDNIPIQSIISNYLVEHHQLFISILYELLPRSHPTKNIYLNMYGHKIGWRHKHFSLEQAEFFFCDNIWSTYSCVHYPNRGVLKELTQMIKQKRIYHLYENRIKKYNFRRKSNGSKKQLKSTLLKHASMFKVCESNLK